MNESKVNLLEGYDDEEDNVCEVTDSTSGSNQSESSSSFTTQTYNYKDHPPSTGILFPQCSLKRHSSNINSSSSKKRIRQDRGEKSDDHDKDEDDVPGSVGSMSCAGLFNITGSNTNSSPSKCDLYDDEDSSSEPASPTNQLSISFPSETNLSHTAARPTTDTEVSSEHISSPSVDSHYQLQLLRTQAISQCLQSSASLSKSSESVITSRLSNPLTTSRGSSIPSKTTLPGPSFPVEEECTTVFSYDSSVVELSTGLSGDQGFDNSSGNAVSSTSTSGQGRGHMSDLVRDPDLKKVLRKKELKELEESGVMPTINVAELRDPMWSSSLLQSTSSDNPSKAPPIETNVWSAIDGKMIRAPHVGGVMKRKHQISWLAQEARDKEFDLLEQTRHTRMSKYQTQMKYGW
eukprot:GHVQ01022389.1.p2 GENE.GHVQ01022389.1~~GHVQ01022389.1.p2  ORF type:complete len:405 (+),score=79.78 GHVQ01022389.1:2859-4073(+)